MRELQRERGDWIGWNSGAEVVALAIEPAQHGVRQLARADAVALLRQFDGLRDGGIRRHAPHMKELVSAEAQQVGEVGVEAYEAAPHALAEEGVEPIPAAQHSIEELLRPAAVAGIEAGRPAIEGGVQEHAAPKVRENRGGGNACIGDSGYGGGRWLGGTRHPSGNIRLCHAAMSSMRDSRVRAPSEGIPADRPLLGMPWTPQIVTA